MEISNKTVLKIVRDVLSQEQREGSLIYWDKQVRKKGERIKIGPQFVEMPFEGMVVFVDLAPRCNWGHPCLYLLVSVKDLSTKTLEASFPPFSGKLPETVAVVLKYGKEPLHERDVQIFDE